MDDPLDDEILIDRAAQGNESAFEQLIARYADRLHTLVAGLIRDRSAVEDVLQDVFFKVHRKLGTFERKSSFYTWLYRVALNSATDHLKKRRLRLRHADDHALNEVVDAGARPGDGLDREELRRRTAEAVESLPSKYRDILVLREYQDLTYEEIADVLQCSKGTVESRLFRARARLRERLKSFLSGELPRE